MRSLADIEADAATVTALFQANNPTSLAFHLGAQLALDVPELLAALEQARSSIAVRLEQEVAANVAPF
jgi:hypothetical protein